MNAIERVSFIDLADNRFLEVLAGIPIEFYERLSGNMTWTEMIESSEVTFDVCVLENTVEYIHIAVSVTGIGSTPNPKTGLLNIEISTSYMLDKPQ